MMKPNTFKSCMLILTMSLLLTACATGYKPANIFLTGPYGYKDNNIGQNSLTVSFTGNTHMKTDQSYRYAMRRAAELTKQHGFQYFEIVSNKSYLIDASNNDVPGGALAILVNDIMDPKMPQTKLTIKLVSHKTTRAYSANKVLKQTT